MINFGKTAAPAARLAIMGASLLVLGACASKPLYSADINAPSPPAPSRPATVQTDEGPPPNASPSQPVESRSLPPPPPQSAYRDYGDRPQPPSRTYPPTPSADDVPPPPPPPMPTRSYSAPPPEPAVPAAPPAPPPPKPLAQGPVTVETPPPVKVGKGDSLIRISKKTGIEVEVLAKLNKLKEPYKLRMGSSLKLPTKRYYTVQAHDSLFAIAHRFGMESAALAEFNDFEASKAIKTRQKLYLPPDAKDKGPPKAPKVAAPPVVKPPRRPPPAYAPEASAPSRPSEAYGASANPPSVQPPERPAPRPAPRAPDQASVKPAPVMVETAPPPSDSDIAEAGRGRFLWPLRGRLLTRYGPQGGGQSSDGVDIDARAGDSVHAAAAGEVVYAGNQVPGFGNLVLIKHPGGWVTAYAHLSTVDVKMRDRVEQDQVVGEAGQTGNVDRPQLHFEVRYAPTSKDKAKPIDPMLVLPR